MERRFNNGDFEKLVRDNANQYRMYPSEKVWKGVHSALHSRRKWYGLTAAIMFLVTGSIVSLFIFNNDKPGNDNLAMENKISVDKKATVTPNRIANSDNTNHPTPAAPYNKINKPSTHTPPDPANSFLNTLAFTSPVHQTQKQVLAPADLNDPVIAENTELTAETSISESIINPEHLAVGFPLINSNHHTSVEKENSEIENGIANEIIGSQSIVDPATEKTMQDAISSIASQKIVLSPKKQARVTAQIYFTPTVSYRKLTENKRVGNSNSLYVPVIDLNNLVKHKPAMGLEFGIEGRYRVVDNFFIKSGLQFNINRYDIKAYSHPTEIATVALNSGYRIDSAAAYSNYRNFNSSSSANWLENLYFQVSMPIGAEMILSNKRNFQWGVSATVQPTYVIGDKAYVISSDYKNYAKFPNLMRRWNISTGVGTFISYSTGHIRWQVGPHLRYQHMSSFVNELTIKEKPYAIGLKVGASLDHSYKKK